MQAIAIGVMLVASRPDRDRGRGRYVDEAAKAGQEALAAMFAAIVLAFLGPLDHRYPYSRAVIVVTFVVNWAALSVLRIAARSLLVWLRGRGHNLMNVIVVGDAPSAYSFIKTVEGAPETGYRILAHLHDPSAGQDSLDDLLALAERNAIGQVILASRELMAQDISRLAGAPELRDVQVLGLPELFGLPPGKLHTTHVVSDFPLLALFGDNSLGLGRFVKRIVDLVGAAIAILIFSPALAAISIGIRRDSSGPILFRQTRIGMDDRPFTVLKFRTMFESVSEDSHREFMTERLTKCYSITGGQNNLHKLKDDPRVTPTGRWLRRYSLDELPQLFNVIRGDMSLVGPRPGLAFEVALYEDWQRRRLDARPGMTGLWQVSGRSRLSPQDMIRLDVQYVETWSLVRDIIILLRTGPALLRREAG
jgi:exopolysaccharide biosynthesis polyprenyl glycosylphosphotransferase